MLILWHYSKHKLVPINFKIIFIKSGRRTIKECPSGNFSCRKRENNWIFPYIIMVQVCSLSLLVEWCYSRGYRNFNISTQNYIIVNFCSVHKLALKIDALFTTPQRTLVNSAVISFSSACLLIGASKLCPLPFSSQAPPSKMDAIKQT